MSDMKNRNTSWIPFTFILFLIIYNGCKKEEEERIPELTTAELTTTDVSNISWTTATSGGNIISDGGSAVTSRGICWNINTSPTITDYRTINGTGIGNFTSPIITLSPNTQYYVRAYATNAIGTAYGNEVIFSTNPAKLPLLTTVSLSSITSKSAKCGGIIASEEGSDIIARGVCWSTSQNPDISDNHTFDGTGIGIYSSLLTGLSLGNTYYVRAYATNSVGTAYGNEISFKTELAIGDSLQGGIIAYIFQSGESGYIPGEIHGIIAAPSDQSLGIVWDEFKNNLMYYTSTNTSVGSGISNTNLIVNILGDGVYAAKLCYDMVLGGYDDWYLPSRDELNILYKNRILIGNFSLKYYWSSSSNDSVSAAVAWSQDFTNGYQSDCISKKSLFYVRAVRNF